MPSVLKRHGLNVYLGFFIIHIMKKSIEAKKKQTEAAREKRGKDAEINDEVLEKKVNEIPGLTYVQLEKVFAVNKFKFKSSYLKNALQRLEKDKKIIGQLIVSKEGKIVKTFVPNYSNQTNSEKKFDQVNIPIELIDEKNWKNVCFIYATRNNEFVITSQKNDKFENFAFHKSTGKLIKTRSVLAIQLPVPVIEYYQIAIDNFSWDIEKDVITLKVIPKLKQETKKKKENKLNILLIEDNPYWSDAFFNIFNKAGHLVIRTEDFSVAKKIIKNQKIDWMLIDDEIKFTKEGQKFFIETKKKFPKIKSIFITSYPIPESKRKSLLNLGFKSIISKKEYSRNRNAEEVAAEQLVRIEVI